jgi:MFS transporter, UMF1 family
VDQLHEATPVVLGDGEIRRVTRAPAIERWSWALFDFSQTIFSMNVATLYFSVWLIQDIGASDLQFASASAMASVLVVLALPVLGALSDARRRRKPWVVGFTILCGLACIAMGSLGATTLPLVGEGVIGGAARAATWHPSVALLLPVLAAYVIANFAYQATHPFYNAMLPELVPVQEQGRMSGLGAAVGYVGSITGVLLVFPFFTGAMPVLGALPPGMMHALRSIIPFTNHGGRVSTFVPTGLLFFLFALPLVLFCRDHNPAPRGTPVRWKRAFQEVAHTVGDAKRHPGALRFILTTLIYQDAIGTIISFMAIYAVKAVGFQKGSEVMLFVVLTVPAVFGSYLAGHLVDRFGPKRTLQTTLTIWIALLIAMTAVPSKAGFWVVGFFLGFNYGGVNAAERPMLLSLIPDVEAGRYFSLLLLSARVAAVAGPLIWGETVGILEPMAGTAIAYRAAVMTVAAMFAIGLFVLRRVPDHRKGTPGPTTLAAERS